MNSNQLKKYVYAKFGLKFVPAIPGSTDLFVLMSPQDSSYFAMLSRFKKQRAGFKGSDSFAVLDLKCGDFAGTIRDLPGFTDPVRLKGKDWVGAILTNNHNDAAIENAFDYAFKLAMNGKRTKVANSQYVYLPGTDSESKYQAQPIKPRKNFRSHGQKPLVPKKIKQMLAMYDYSILPAQGRKKNFYYQGRFMADFQDDYPKFFAFKRYYPVYHDMNVGQLRTYFTWRTKWRRGQVQKTSTSYAFIYVYELLNNIGVKNPQLGYQKLLAFKQDYAQKYDPEMLPYLKDWLKDYVLFYQVKAQLKTAFAAEIKSDHDYLILRHPAQYPAVTLAEIFARRSSYWQSSKAIKQHEKSYAAILKCVWQELLQTKKYGLAYYSGFVARPVTQKRPVFNGSVFYPRAINLSDIEIDQVRKYSYQKGEWLIHYDQPVKNQRKNLNVFLHELDRLSRQFLHLGHPLKARFIDNAVLKAIKNGLKNYQIQQKQAKIQAVKINFADLKQIRANASLTRDSLLTDEEKEPEPAVTKPVKKPAPQPSKPAKATDTYGLNENELFFLKALLQKRPWQAKIKQQHLMPSILADSINEKLMDEIGDAVIEFDAHNQPQIISDYQTDLEKMFLKG